MKRLLILDIDETLLHSTYEDLRKEPDFYFKERKVYLRPHLDMFLEYCFRNFDVAIWTSSKAIYAKFVLKKIVNDITLFKFIWTRKNCDKKNVWNGFTNETKYIKDINKIEGYKIDNILFIDDTPQNIIPIYLTFAIDEYRGCYHDDALKILITKITNYKMGKLKTIERVGNL
jgi:TFIIF-interacting CTD phosphatase-like protein